MNTKTLKAIKRCCAEGLTQAETVRKLGLSRTVVSYWKHKLKLPFRNDRLVPESELALAREQLRKEISASRAERASSPPFKPGPLEW